jgi:DNA-binding GntR family transcriptional regulator
MALADNSGSKSSGAVEENGEREASSLVWSMVDAIIDGVMTGRYAPGQRLIAADLADEYNVSRAPVREALHVLAGEGVVELIPNRGAKIRQLSVQQLVDFLEFTESICSVGVRKATQLTYKTEVRARLDAAFRAIEEAWDRRHAADFVNALYQYHITLNEEAGNFFSDFFYRRPYMRFYTMLLSTRAPGRHWEHYILNYRLIHDTIMSGDPYAAVATFVAHIRWVLKIMQE